MQLRPVFAALIVLGLSGAAAAEPATPPATPSPASPRPERPLTALPYSPSLDVTVMDRAIDPCVDFYHYSCGTWSAKNPIPPDRSGWSVYGKLGEENRRFLWGMLEEASRPDPGRDADTRKIGDYFAACMDETAIEKAGAAPLKADLDAVAALQDRAALAPLLGRLVLSAPREALFGFGSGQDFGNSSQVIAFASAGGLGLPDRDYYLKDDPKSKETRERYGAYLRQIFTLIGDPAPAVSAEAVVRIETALAQASLSRVDRRDPHKIYHRMTKADLQALTPSFRWDAFLGALGRPGLDVVNVTEPDFFHAVEQVVAGASVADLRSYLRFHVTRAQSPYLSAPFVRADFDFYEAYLRGVQSMSPRWKRCVGWIDRDLGEALGQVFVRQAFPPQVKTEAQEMVRNIRAAMETRIKELPWMSEATKQQALIKLHGMRDKVGYPEHWRDYTALEVRRDDLPGNVARANSFDLNHDLDKIGKPVDKGEWGMTPPTVNAYYNPFMNDMNFPAGVLLPPLYDPKIDAAPNYGDTGSTIGHELTHGFDDEGRQFDAEGNLRDWWTPQDDAEFRQRAQCVSDQYGQYVAVDDIKINSKLTLGEDVADLGGTIIAYQAWKNATQGQTMTPRDGLTPDQRFFVGFAQWACSQDRPEARRLSAKVNPHSPPEFRINGVVVNMPEFAAAFACKPGQPMVKEPEKVCRIW